MYIHIDADVSCQLQINLYLTYVFNLTQTSKNHDSVDAIVRLHDWYKYKLDKHGKI